MNDLRFGLRMLRRHPGFTAAFVLIAAVGIGAVTVMFSVLWGIVLRPLPFRQPERLVWVQALTDQGQDNTLSALDYFDYRAQCGAFQSLAAICVWQSGRTVTGTAEPERVTSVKVSSNFFETLGVRPLYGRSFAGIEEASDGFNTVIVSHAFWQRMRGAATRLAGATLTLDGTPHQILGVMPAGFGYPVGVDLWVPMQRGGDEESGRGNNNFFAIGRLADGVSLAAARNEMAVIAARISNAFPKEKGGWSVALIPLHDRFFGSVRPRLMMLMAATVLVLLIVCANLSSLLLARVMSRRGELAVRLSLGAPRGKVMSQLFIESLVLTASGASLGLLLAWLCLQGVKAFAPGGLPRLSSIQIDGYALLATIAATAVTTLLAGLAPAFRASRLSLLGNLRDVGRATEGAGHLTFRQFLVGSQLALSLVLLVVTGLLLTSVTRLQRVDSGMQPDRLLTLDVQLPEPGASAQRLQQRYDQMLERIRALPGVTRASGADQLPFFGGPWNGVNRADRPAQKPSDALPATRRIVTEDFFQTMGIPMLVGRAFERTDTADSRYVTVVSRSLARQLYPDDDAVGKTLMLESIPLEIIGVAGDVRDFGLAADFRPAFYVSVRQHPSPPSAMRFVIRSAGAPAALVPAVHAAIREIDKAAPLSRIGTMAQWIFNSTSRERFSGFVLSAFAAVAVGLAAVGLFGLMAHTVAQRTREIGIRMALGATPRGVLGVILSRALLLILSGIAVGLGCAAAATRLIASQLYQTSPTDGLTFIVASAALAVTALLACITPALRAVKVNPMVALRCE